MELFQYAFEYSGFFELLRKYVSIVRSIVRSVGNVWAKSHNFKKYLKFIENHGKSEAAGLRLVLYR